MRKLVMVGAFVALVLGANHAHAEIQTKQAADAFLDNYCIELVNAIKDLYEEQKILAAQARWHEFLEKGKYIGDIAEIYSKLCR